MAETSGHAGSSPELIWRDRRPLWALVVVLTAALAILQADLVEKAAYADALLPAPASSIPYELGVLAAAMDVTILFGVDPFRRNVVMIAPAGLPGLDDVLAKALLPLGLRSTLDLAYGGHVYRPAKTFARLWVRTRMERTLNGLQPVLILPRSASPLARNPSPEAKKLREAIEAAVKEAGMPLDLPKAPSATEPTPSAT